MKIGIDFDNTLVNTMEVSKQFLDEFKPNNGLNSYHELPAEEEVVFFSKYIFEITDSLKLHPNAKKALNILKNSHIKLYLITARGIEGNLLIKPTKEFLAKNGLEFDKKFFSAPKKGKICKENNIDLLIDDNDYVLEDAVNNGVKVLKFGKKSDKYPYALNWNEVIDYLRKEGLCE